MKKIISGILTLFFLSSCGIYSFTGASIPSSAETISVEHFGITAISSPPSLSQTITEGLKDLILSQTQLDLIERNGDLNFRGKIINYSITPMAIQANESAGQNRLTIEIEVVYNNNFHEQQNFESIFSRYRDFNSSENLTDIESLLIEEITKELLEDIFNKAFVNW